MEEFPTISQAILILLLTDVLLIGGGMLLFWCWTSIEESPPFWLTVTAAAASLVIFLGVTRFLYVESTNASIAEALMGDPTTLPDPTEDPKEGLYRFRDQSDRTIPILALCLVFWTVPVGYFGNKILAAFAARQMERISWLELELPDYDVPKVHPTDDFQEARLLAAEGDIDAAVDRYKQYVKNRPHALFAASKLLEVHGRFREEADLLKSVVNEGADQIELWAPATFRLATINERHLENVDEAVKLFNQVALRTPDSEFGELAQTQLERIKPEGDALLDMLDANFGDTSTPPPDESRTAQSYSETSSINPEDYSGESRPS